MRDSTRSTKGPLTATSDQSSTTATPEQGLSEAAKKWIGIGIAMAAAVGAIVVIFAFIGRRTCKKQDSASRRQAMMNALANASITETQKDSPKRSKALIRHDPTNPADTFYEVATISTDSQQSIAEAPSMSSDDGVVTFEAEDARLPQPELVQAKRGVGRATKTKAPVEPANLEDNRNDRKQPLSGSKVPLRASSPAGSLRCALAEAANQRIKQFDRKQLEPQLKTPGASGSLRVTPRSYETESDAAPDIDGLQKDLSFEKPHLVEPAPVEEEAEAFLTTPPET